MKTHLFGAVSAGIFVFLSTATSAALIDSGGGLIYDDVLDITWAQPDNTFRVWDAANTWASGLMLGGVSGWRLPYISVAAGAGPFTGTPFDCSTASELACRDNELGYMFYHNLSGTLGSRILLSGDQDLGLFPTLGDSFFWYGTEFDPYFAWVFAFGPGGFLVGGEQGLGNKNFSHLLLGCSLGQCRASTSYGVAVRQWPDRTAGSSTKEKSLTI